MSGIENSISKYPDAVKNFIKSCEEMLKDSGPDKTADYFEEKTIIQTALGKFKKPQAVLNESMPKF